MPASLTSAAAPHSGSPKRTYPPRLATLPRVYALLPSPKTFPNLLAADTWLAFESFLVRS